MTTEEIKESVNMSDVLTERGISIRNGMCKCPFHDDRKPSMKVYKDGCRCFTCAESWDVFGFVMKYDNVTFKQAFVSLGGTYKQSTKRERILAQGRRDRAKADRSAHKMVRKTLQHELHLSLMICRLCDKVYPPLSDEWCEIKNMEPIFIGYYEMKFQDDPEEVNDLDVYRECKRFNERFLPRSTTI